MRPDILFAAPAVLLSVEAQEKLSRVAANSTTKCFIAESYPEELDKNIQFLSDYKEGAFGRATGLLMDGLMLLARSVIIVGKDGRVRYIQVVPEITHLPDMERAIEEAQKLVK